MSLSKAIAVALRGPLAADDGSTLSDDQWLARCARRFTEVAGLEDEDAMEAARLQLEWAGNNPGEDPETAADEEMADWVD